MSEPQGNVFWISLWLTELSNIKGHWENLVQKWTIVRRCRVFKSSPLTKTVEGTVSTRTQIFSYCKLQSYVSWFDLLLAEMVTILFIIFKTLFLFSRLRMPLRFVLTIESSRVTLTVMQLVIFLWPPWLKLLSEKFTFDSIFTASMAASTKSKIKIWHVFIMGRLCSALCAGEVCMTY